MASPFPGMDPYLERPSPWPDVHHGLITYGRDLLQGQVGPDYYVAIERRVYLESPQARHFLPDGLVVDAGPTSDRAPSEPLQPDPEVTVVLDEAEVREAYLELREVEGDRVVTVVEILSPSNKQPGRGREEYLRKQAEVLSSEAHLVEVDLLREGLHTVAVPEPALGSAPYCAVVSRSGQRNRRGLYAFGLQDRLPRVAVPLTAPALDTALDLRAVLDRAYEAGAYARRIDYARDPTPALPPADAAWARELLGGRGDA